VYALILLVVVALVSLLITRVATVALTLTGMSKESARFQARSALSGVGFTTQESEAVVGHPVRRRVVMALMLVGSVGLATAIAGILGTFVNVGAEARLVRTVLLVGALTALYLVSRSPVIDRRLSRLIAALIRRYTDLEARDYERLLHVAADYSVQEVPVEDGHWLADRSLGELQLRDEGIIVLGVTRCDGTYLGVPDQWTTLCPGDTITTYGRAGAVERITQRAPGPAGDAAHQAAVAEHHGLADRERSKDHGRSAGRRARQAAVSDDVPDTSAG
jgi:hypothetical protein